MADNHVYRVTLSNGNVRVGSAVRYAALRRQYPKRPDAKPWEVQIVKVERTEATWEEIENI